MEGKWPSLSLLDRRICALFFYWSTWTVFLGAVLVRCNTLKPCAKISSERGWKQKSQISLCMYSERAPAHCLQGND